VTPFQLHVNRWGDCQQCELHRVRHKLVLARGRVPCDVLFIGEAPGASEDVLGLPFVGPAGHMLDYIIERSIGEHNELRKEKGLPGLRVAMTNLVCCIPRILGEKGAPEPVHIYSCAPRLQEFVEIAHPRLVVCVGSMSTEWLDPRDRDHVSLPIEVAMIDMVHPAYILRATMAQRDSLIGASVVSIANSLEEVF
jgi:uracil-DNA glycosylase family 4